MLCELAGQMISVRLYPGRVSIEVIASHERLADRDCVRYDWQHNTLLVERTPGALAENPVESDRVTVTSRGSPMPQSAVSSISATVPRLLISNVAVTRICRGSRVRRSISIRTFEIDMRWQGNYARVSPMLRPRSDGRPARSAVRPVQCQIARTATIKHTRLPPVHASTGPTDH